MKDITKPRLILFDYGHTLLSEPDWNPKRGLCELIKYANESYDEEEINRIFGQTEKYYNEILLPMKDCGFDASFQTAARLIGGLCGISLSVPLCEAEEIYWRAETEGAVMPKADKLISCLNSLEIPYGVVSNLTMSGLALERRIKRLIPEANPILTVTSSDISLRKPNPLIFEYALRKCGEKAENTWFIGDNPQADIEGASAAGIFPVWFDSVIECPYRDKEREAVPTCDMLRIRDYDELIGLLELL